MDKWQTIEVSGLQSIWTFASAVMMRVDEEDSVDSLADEGVDDDEMMMVMRVRMTRMRRMMMGRRAMMSVMVMSHREVDGFVDSFAPSQQTLGMEKGRGSTRHVTSEATRGLARVSHHVN